MVAPACSSSTQVSNQDRRQIDISLHRKQFVRNREVCLEQQEARRITTPQGRGKASAGSFRGTLWSSEMSLGLVKT